VYIYGVNPVLEALRSHPRRIQRLFVVRGKSGTRLQEVIDEARVLGVPIAFEPLEALSRRAASTHHQSVVAETSEIPTLEFREAVADRPRRVLLPDGVEDPRNLGALLRTAEAAGISTVLLPSRHGCGLNATVIRTSAGAAMHLRFGRIGNTAQSLEKLKEMDYWIVGLDMSGEEVLGRLDSSLPMVLVVGGESRGLRRLVREKCDYLVRLPMLGKVSSLNLSVAAGILIYGLLADGSRVRSS
jgi:23S rRNA (guanosine2251-2'-O)-methyltransferase